MIRVRIGPNGRVNEAHVEGGFPRTACPDTNLAVAIDAAILEALRGWRFQLPEAVRRGTTETVVYRFPPEREDTWAYGCLWGRVLDDSTGRPLSYVNIILLGTRAGVQSDTTGAFNFETIPPGSLRVQAQTPWYDTVTREIPMRAGQVDSIELRLKRNPWKTVIVDTLGRPR